MRTTSFPFPTADERHTTAIYWPNGAGETPCTEAYAALADAISALLATTADEQGGVHPSDLSADDYERLCRMEVERDNLALAGHLARPISYDEPSPFAALLA